MPQIDAKSERLAIQAAARAILWVVYRQTVAHGEPAPKWAEDHAKVILGHCRTAGFSLSPCEPDPKALESPLYSIGGTG